MLDYCNWVKSYILNQYINSKPIKYGYKVWVCATSTGSGVRFEPYCDIELVAWKDNKVVYVASNKFSGLPQ